MSELKICGFKEEPQVVAKLDEYARRRGMQRSDAIRGAIRAMLEKAEAA